MTGESNTKYATLMLKKVFLFLSLAFFAIQPVHLGAYDFKKPLYGAAYYSEYTPSDRLDKDIQMMKAAGLSVVRDVRSS